MGEWRAQKGHGGEKGSSNVVRVQKAGNDVTGTRNKNAKDNMAENDEKEKKLKKKNSNPSSHALKREIDLKGKVFQCMPGITVGIRSLSKAA